MKTIIVATDFSKAATNALHYAAALARETGAGIILFNAFHLPANAANKLFTTSHINQLVDENKVQLEKLAFEIIKEYGIKVEAVSSISYVAEELNHLADKHKADLIVMGIQEKAAEYGFLGSVTTYMISNTQYPVLVIPEGTTFMGIKEIAFACDYQAFRPNHKLPLLKELAKALKANIQILHVEKAKEPSAVMPHPKKERIPDLENLFADVPHTYRDLTDIHILDGIERGVKDSHADLLVMVPQHTGFWNMIFNRSKTRKMAQKTHVPLLALPFKEEEKAAVPVMKVNSEK